MAELVEVVAMIPGLSTHLIAAGAALAIGASGAWWVQAQRYGLELEQIKHQQTTADLAAASQAVQDMAGFQKGLNDALTDFQTTQQKNTLAQQDLGRLLLDLRGTTAGLRSDFAGLPQRIATAAQPALADFSEQCVAVFKSMADAGGQLAERGAEIARKADEHAANERLIHESWPKRTSR